MVVDDVATAVPLARALVAGGLPVIELTLRTPVALDAIRAIADEVPEILVGAGTVLDARPGQARARRRRPVPGVTGGDAGRCSAAMADTGLPFLPGTATVSEVLAVLEAGLTEMKFFPAEASGGTAFLSSIAVAGPGRPVLPDRRDHRGHRARRTSRCRTSAASAAPGSPPRTSSPPLPPPATGPPSRPSPGTPPPS